MYDALWNSAEAGDVKAFERVVNEQNQEFAVNWSNPGKAGLTFLTIASACGHSNVVSFLLGKGAIVDKPNVDGFTALYGAVNQNHVDTARLLLEKGADPNCQSSNEEYAFPLYVAAQLNNAEICELLLSFGAYLAISACSSSVAFPSEANSQNADMS